MPLMEEAHRKEKEAYRELDETSWRMESTSFVTLCGDPMTVLEEAPEKTRLNVCPRCGLIGNVDAYYNLHNDEAYFNCYPCDTTTPSGGGHPEEQGLLCRVRPHKGLIYIEDELQLTMYKHHVAVACVSARKARFEYGQTPDRPPAHLIHWNYSSPEIEH